ncbi:helix-turn-helix domain-containing protein [Streptomyces venezuelae]|uniref:helix-turn-helix domain-containing protein n=1 Tax=Streptomyces venezuelae TaxID=54571 RepID=UPI00123AB609|nr:helix-turn-helix transcriptional regulator [Streptomyces venezuelae]
MTATRRCANCRRSFTPKGGPGRPRLYCTTTCRAAAHRKAPPDDAATDASHHELIVEIAETLRVQADSLIASVHERQGSSELLRHRVELARQLEDLEAAVIRRARVAGESWQTLAAPLRISNETLRKKWSAQALERRLERRVSSSAEPSARPPDGPVFLPRQRGTMVGQVPRTRADDTTPPTPTPSPLTGDAAAPRTARQLLCAALSQLQRHQGGSLRELADHAGITPSYVSRVLSGERRPSWPVTRAIVESCGEEPAVLYPLWRLAHGQPVDVRVVTSEQAALEFHRFIRSLHLAADRPDPSLLVQPGNHELGVTEVDQVLTQVYVPDWPTTVRLVSALRGRPTDVRPLWHAARTLPPKSPGDRCSLQAASFG